MNWKRKLEENWGQLDMKSNIEKTIIKENGYAWYGKLGAAISDKSISNIMKNETPRILLIQSGKANRYWAYVKEIKKEEPIKREIPEYYRDISGKFNSWFKVVKFEHADSKVMSQCIVSSSKDILSNVSKHSMSPYFIIEYTDESVGDNENEME